VRTSAIGAPWAHEDQHCPAGNRKHERNRQTFQQHGVFAQPIVAAAAKLVRSTGDLGAVAKQIAPVKAIATQAAAIRIAVSGDLARFKGLIGLTNGGSPAPREFIAKLRKWIAL
jgi:hypothetical protein